MLDDFFFSNFFLFLVMLICIAASSSADKFLGKVELAPTIPPLIIEDVKSRLKTKNIPFVTFVVDEARKLTKPKQPVSRFRILERATIPLKQLLCMIFFDTTASVSNFAPSLPFETSGDVALSDGLFPPFTSRRHFAKE